MIEVNIEGLQDYKHMWQVSKDKHFLVVVILQGMYCLPAYEALVLTRVSF